jgi:rapamycin-insensitive companion of mTOR
VVYCKVLCFFCPARKESIYPNRSLARDNKHALEREQVVKLIRTIVDIVSEPRDRRGITGTKTIPLSEPIMRAFVAVAEHAEDLFRPICVQTLAEMSAWVVFL